MRISQTQNVFFTAASVAAEEEETVHRIFEVQAYAFIVALTLFCPDAASAQISATPEGRAIENQRFAVRPEQQAPRQGLPLTPSSSSRIAGAHGEQNMKTRSVVGDIGDTRLVLTVARSKKGQVRSLIPELPRRSSRLSTMAAFEMDIGQSDSLSLFAGWKRDRIRPATLVPGRHYFVSVERSAGLILAHDDRLWLGLTAFDAGPTGRRSTVDRMIELSSGGIRKSSGFAFMLAAAPTERRGSLVYGLDLRRQKTDMSLIPSSGTRLNEASASVFATLRF